MKEYFLMKIEIEVFKNLFKSQLSREMQRIGFIHGDFQPPDPSDINFMKMDSHLEISMDKVTEEQIDRLNHSYNLNNSVDRLLKKYYRYDGEWRFEKGLPF